MKYLPEYVVTIFWPGLGKREYRFSNFHTAYQVICDIKSENPGVRVTCKTERRDLPKWLTEIFTDT